MDEQDRVEKSQEILGNIKEWRRAHPKATFVEIEEEVHKRMMQLEAQVLQEAVQASSNREWRGTPTEEHPRCPRVPGSLESTRDPPAYLTGQWRTERHPAEDLRNVPHVRGEFFFLWMTS